MRKLSLREALKTIEEKGILLVFPINNQKQPPSLWSEFFPRSKMRWEWDQDGDTRVSDLWHLREELSRSGKVVYSKWFRGRATFFSKRAFTWALSFSGGAALPPTALSGDARTILEILEMDSPQSTKQLKRATGLIGRYMEARYESALKELWRLMLIVAFGEVDEGAFPSLAVGATKILFEEIYQQAKLMNANASWLALESHIQAQSPFLKFLAQCQFVEPNHGAHLAR